MTVPHTKEELVRRLEQSRRLSRDTNDPTTHERLAELINELETEQKQGNEIRPPNQLVASWQPDIICPKCSAGYRRIELAGRKGTKGEFHCLLCEHVLELFDGSRKIAIRLMVQPEKIFE